MEVVTESDEYQSSSEAEEESEGTSEAECSESESEKKQDSSEGEEEEQEEEEENEEEESEESSEEEGEGGFLNRLTPKALSPRITDNLEKANEERTRFLSPKMKQRLNSADMKVPVVSREDPKTPQKVHYRKIENRTLGQVLKSILHSPKRHPKSPEGKSRPRTRYNSATDIKDLWKTNRAVDTTPIGLKSQKDSLKRGPKPSDSAVNTSMASSSLVKPKAPLKLFQRRCTSPEMYQQLRHRFESIVVDKPTADMKVPTIERAKRGENPVKKIPIVKDKATEAQLQLRISNAFDYLRYEARKTRVGKAVLAPHYYP
jgi:hypothetical protein